MPVNVCVACGLTVDPQGRLTIDTPDWPFICTPSESPYRQPVGCENGQVYAPPRQLVMTDRFSADNAPGLNYVAARGTDADGFKRQFELEITNRDPCRRMHGILLVFVDARVRMQPGSLVTYSIAGNQRSRYAWPGSSGNPRQFWAEQVADLSISIPPGGTQTVQWSVSTEMNVGDGELISIYNIARLMAVSSQLT